MAAGSCHTAAIVCSRPPLLLLSLPLLSAWSFDPSGGAATCSPQASGSAPHCFLKHSVAPVSGHPCRTSGTPHLTLQPPAFPKLPASVVRPTGWLKAQLELQVSGLAGHLHLFWPDVANSEFIGGKNDSVEHNHERFPYCQYTQTATPPSRHPSPPCAGQPQLTPVSAL